MKKHLEILRMGGCALFCLCALLIMPGAAWAADVSLWTGEEEGQPCSVARSGETLYVATNLGLGAYDLKTGEARMLMDGEALSRMDVSAGDGILAGGERPYYYDAYASALYEIDGGALGASLDMTDTALAWPGMRARSLLALAGGLYFISGGEDTGAETARICRIDLETYREARSPAQGFTQLIPYGEGTLLAVRSAAGRGKDGHFAAYRAAERAL